MAHFARLDENNTVTMVTVVSNEDMIDENGNEVEALGIAVCEAVVGPGPWVQTSYNGNFRGRYAAVRAKYLPDLDVFTSPAPSSSWVLTDDLQWEPPIPMPDDGNMYRWNEETVSWEPFPDTDAPVDK